MKTAKKIFVVILVITLYCNIGWIVGSYYYSNVLRIPHEQLTILGKAAAGGWAFNSADAFTTAERSENSAKILAVVVLGALWPIGLFIVAASWIVYAAYYAGWFIIWGGLAKLLGFA